MLGVECPRFALSGFAHRLARMRVPECGAGRVNADAGSHPSSGTETISPVRMMLRYAILQSSLEFRDLVEAEAQESTLGRERVLD